jgi:tetratricopeptide (TPR) repeat protein
LDDWASITPDLRRRTWLLDVAREADADPVRDRLRQPELWRDGAGLARLAEQLNVPASSPQFARALGRIVRENGGDAVPLLTAAQARLPDDLWLNVELGEALYYAGRSDQAIIYFRVALALRPQSAGAHIGIGAALIAMGKTDEGIAEFQQAIHMDPRSYMAHTHLGTAFYVMGRLDEAMDHLQQALSINPKYVAARHNLGLALDKKGRTGEALDQVRQALAIDPNSVFCHTGLGNFLYRQGRWREAIEQYRQAVRIDPKDPTIHQYLGVALQAKGDLIEAVDQLQQALRLDPSSLRSRQYLSLWLYDAACAAARAAAGQDRGDAPLGEPARAEKRVQAMGWLRADLPVMLPLIQGGNAMDRPLSRWQTDPALASVRDPAALALLPDAERKQWQRLWTDVAAMRAADALGKARESAGRRDWAQAFAGYARCLTRGPRDDGHLWFEIAAAFLLSGDRSGYADACARMVELSSKSTNVRAYHVARACTLAPDAVGDASLPGRLAEKELQGAGKQFWSLTEQGALAYRDGRFQEAVLLFEQSLRADAKPGRAVVNWLWLALANHRLGKQEEARRWLGKAQAWLDQYRDGMPARAEQELGLHLHNWLEAHVLRREAEALIQPAGRQGGTENRQGGAPPK